MKPRTCANCGLPIGPTEPWGVRDDGKPVHQQCPPQPDQERQTAPKEPDRSD